jgi:hypothetical protein
LLLRRDLREGHAHAKPVTVVSNFAENFQHLVVMGETKKNARTWWDGIQRVDVAARAADIRSARSESGAMRKFYYLSASTIGYLGAPRRSTVASGILCLRRTSTNWFVCQGGVRSWRGMTSPAAG